MSRVEVSSKVRTFTSIAVANTAISYLANYQVGSLLTIPGALRQSNRTGLLISASLVDSTITKNPFSLMLFRAAPTISSTNGTLVNISATEMRSKFCGFFDIGSSDWQQLSACSVASVNNLGVSVDSADAINYSLYALLIAQATFSYSSANALNLSLTIVQDG